MDVAAKLDVDVGSLDWGYGSLVFSWLDPEYGERQLGINVDGWCGREMPIRSGQGPPQFLEVSNRVVRLRFGDKLAAKLELPNEVTMRIDASPEEVEGLQQFLSSLDNKCH